MRQPVHSRLRGFDWLIDDVRMGKVRP
jgi:hypothetical protein